MDRNQETAHRIKKLLGETIEFSQKTAAIEKRGTTEDEGTTTVFGMNTTVNENLRAHQDAVINGQEGEEGVKKEAVFKEDLGNEKLNMVLKEIYMVRKSLNDKSKAYKRDQQKKEEEEDSPEVTEKKFQSAMQEADRQELK